MLNHYSTRLARLPFGVAIALSLVILFTPDSGVPVAPPGTDKVIHLLLFAALAITGRTAGTPAPALLAGLIGYAGLSEVLQAALPIGRSGDVIDASVDILGAIAGLAVYAFARRRGSGAT